VCETLVVVTEAVWSRRTVTIAFVLFLLILMPVAAQPPSSLRTLPGRNARIFKKPTPTPTVTSTPTNKVSFRATLEVNPSPPVDVNQEVTFIVVPRPPGAVEYRFNFGDGKTSNWITQSQTTHRYSESKIYSAYAEIRGRARALAQGNTPRKEVKVVQRSNPTPSATAPPRITPSPPSYTPSPIATATVPARITASPPFYTPSPTVTATAPPRITASPPSYTPSPTVTATVPARITPSPTVTATASALASPSPHTPSPTALPTATPSISPPLKVYLSVDKNPISVGDSVTFSIATNLPARNRQYRYEVDFGDRSNPSVKTTNSFPHVFKAAGHYTASVKVLDGGSRAHADLAISVDGGKRPWHWVYILAGLAAVALFGILIKPTFHLHTDWHEPQRPPRNVAINYGLYFHPNVSAGQDRLATDGPRLILRRRTQ
jgi:PKD domain